MRNAENLRHDIVNQHGREMGILEAQLESSQQQLQATDRYLRDHDDEAAMLRLDLDTLKDENTRLKVSPFWCLYSRKPWDNQRNV